MCLIAFAWRPDHSLPLLVAANRDEFYARPSLPAGPWQDAPGIIAGRDLQAGGTWMGLGPNGRFAALTNIRRAGQPQSERSRGELPARFLSSKQAPEHFLQELTKQRQCYTGFNLLLGDGQTLWHFNSHSGHMQSLQPGVYGLSNADLNSPWPKVERIRQALEATLAAPEPEHLFGLLRDPTPADDANLPETGFQIELERMLSSIFITSPVYGTRASTLVMVNADGSRVLHERSFGAEGKQLGEVRFEYPVG